MARRTSSERCWTGKETEARTRWASTWDVRRCARGEEATRLIEGVLARDGCWGPGSGTRLAGEGPGVDGLVTEEGVWGAAGHVGKEGGEGPDLDRKMPGRWRWRWTDGRECCPDWCWCRSPAGCPCRKANNTRTNKSPAFKIKDAAREDTYWPAAPRRLPRLACPAPPAPHRFVLPRSPPPRLRPRAASASPAERNPRPSLPRSHFPRRCPPLVQKKNPTRPHPLLTTPVPTIRPKTARSRESLSPFPRCFPAPFSPSPIALPRILLLRTRFLPRILLAPSPSSAPPPLCHVVIFSPSSPSQY